MQFKNLIILSSVLLVVSAGVSAQSRLGTDVPSVQPVTNSVFQPNATITEGFDVFANTIAAGWFSKNNSALANPTAPFNAGWVQGQGTQIAPAAGQAGGANSFAQFAFQTVGNGMTGRGKASNWLVSPVVNYGAGATLEFWTIKRNAPFSDQVQVRFSTTTGAVNVGTLPTDLGDFTNLAFTVAPDPLAQPGVSFACPAGGVTATQSATANLANYPTDVWCKITLTGFPASGAGRIAFRHSTEDTGNEGNNGTVGGIDTFSFVEGSSGPTSTFTAVTPSGSNITLARTLPAATSTSSLVFNVTGANAALTCTTTSPGYSVAPTPLNLVVGTPGTVTVTHTGSTAGSFTGTVTCTGAAGTAGGPFVYNFTTNVSAAVVPIIPVPALGNISLMLLMAGFLGLGMVLVGRRQA